VICALCPYPDTCSRSARCVFAADNQRMVKKRGYSDEFPTTGKTHRYMLDYIPAPLWRAVRAKAKREGISLRTLILRLLSAWLKAS
jgi:hypothetical protein